jgi:hypothetical protein
MQDEYDYRVRLIALSQCRCGEPDGEPDRRSEETDPEQAAA